MSPLVTPEVHLLVTSSLPALHPHVVVTADGHVTTVTIDRPDTKNACTGDMWVAIGETFRQLAYSGTRVIVLTGASSDFCAGADLSGGGVGGGGSSNLVSAMRILGDAVLAVHDCPVPTIARVDGVAVGAGLGLALACDLTVCSERARFSAIFARRGISLDFGTSWLLRQRLGVHRAKKLAFTAEIMSGAEALAIGLVNDAVPAEHLDRVTNELARVIAAGPPMALSMTKRELDFAGGCSLAQALELETFAQNVNFGTADMREALAAWIERRAPDFTGR